MRMCFDEADNIRKILRSFALPLSRLAPSFDLAGQCVFKTGYTQQNAMDIGGDTSLGEISVKIFGRKLEADF